jgi:hypothetical protein
MPSLCWLLAAFGALLLSAGVVLVVLGWIVHRGFAAAVAETDAIVQKGDPHE